MLVLPKVTGAEWTAIWGVVRRLSAQQVVLLVIVWLLGLYAYTFVLTAALPGLTHGQAFTLNLTGSGVSNLAPFGGALGIGVNYAQARSWGFSTSSIALFTMVTGLWNILAKLVLPLLALLGLFLAGHLSDPRLAAAAGVAVAVLAVLLGAVLVALGSERGATLVGRASEAVGTRLARLLRMSREVHWDRAVRDLRHRTIDLLRANWVSLSVSMAVYSLLQAALLWLILDMVGSHLGPTIVFAGFAFGRLLTSFVLTPGGVGVTETGTAALLVALGGEPAAASAGVLLFSGFTYFLEIPVGAVSMLRWMWQTRGRGRARS